MQVDNKIVEENLNEALWQQKSVHDFEKKSSNKNS
jgi:hypothetical protein